MFGKKTTVYLKREVVSKAEQVIPILMAKFCFASLNEWKNLMGVLINNSQDQECLFRKLKGFVLFFSKMSLLKYFFVKIQRFIIFLSQCQALVEQKRKQSKKNKKTDV